nr:unnamed protein product [Callosobruchus analis]
MKNNNLPPLCWLITRVIDPGEDGIKGLSTAHFLLRSFGELKEETHLKPTESFTFRGSKIFRKDVIPQHRAHGGVATLLKKHSPSVNIRSLCSKDNETHDLLKQHDISVFGITETWLSADIDNSLVAIEGYTFYRSDRVGRGGGVGVYVDSTLYSVFLTYMYIEHICVTLHLPNIKLTLLVIYRPPHTNLPASLSILDTIVS